MKRAIPILILVALISAGYFWWTTQGGTEASNFTLPLSSSGGKGSEGLVVGSGTIEAEIVAITTEIGGRIVAIHADEGEPVSHGDLLVELDTTSLQANRNQLEAALATARANLAEVSAPPRPEVLAAAKSGVRQARAARDGAYAVWQEAQSVVENPLELNVRVEAARGQFEVLEDQVEAAQATLRAAEIQRDEAARNQLNDEAMTLSQAAVTHVQAAQANLAAAEAELAGARNQLAMLMAMRDNPLILVSQANASKTAYQQAIAAMLVAEAKLASVQAGPMPEEVAIAAAQVQQAEAALASLEIQIEKLTLSAPRDGIITDRPANPGELAAPGATLMNLGDLDQVRLTVFISETQIGHVRVGQSSRVTVDAYPGETFEGKVAYISPEAEFTPKNVQTEEERVNLVFAVEISLDNPDHRLKPGMPADAHIFSSP